MSTVNKYTAFLNELPVATIGSHFMEAISTRDWTSTITDTGTIATGNIAGGVVTITCSDGSVTNNDEAYLSSINSPFIYKANTSLYARAKVNWTETTAGVHNIGFGFMNAPGADMLIDTGGGPKVSGSTIALYKVTTESVWRLASACNGVSTITKSANPAVSATDYDLQVDVVDAGDGANMTVTAKVNGEYLKDTNGVVIRQNVPITSAAQMALWVGAKLGAATNNDTLKVDYLYGAQSIVPIS